MTGSRPAKLRVHDWSGFAALGAFVLMLVEFGRGQPIWALGWLLLAAGCGMVTRYWSVKHPGPLPHRLSWTLRIARGSHSPERLQRILQPQSGERLLEVGPGIGMHSMPIATALAPDGTLDVFDIQQEMLDDVMRRATHAGLTNITAKQGDAQQLPYADATFDGAYLVGVLGEIPDGQSALRELRRVLKPGGRLVIGEVFFDPDFVWFASLKDRAEQACFAFERRLGGSLAYLARFRPT